MSAIASHWILAERKAPSRHSAGEDKKHSREEEFRSALDSYIAEYADHQKRRSDIIGQSSSSVRVDYNLWRFGSRLAAARANLGLLLQRSSQTQPLKADRFSLARVGRRISTE